MDDYISDPGNDVCINGIMRYVILKDEDIDCDYPLHIFLFCGNQKIGIVESYDDMDAAIEVCRALNETLSV